MKKTFFQKLYAILFNSILLTASIAPTQTACTLQSTPISSPAISLSTPIKTSAKKNKETESLIFTDQKTQEKKKFWLKVGAAFLVGSGFYWLFNENIYNLFTANPKPKASDTHNNNHHNADYGDSAGAGYYGAAAGAGAALLPSWDTIVIGNQQVQGKEQILPNGIRVVNVRVGIQSGAKCGYHALNNAEILLNFLNNPDQVNDLAYQLKNPTKVDALLEIIANHRKIRAQTANNSNDHNQNTLNGTWADAEEIQYLIGEYLIGRQEHFIPILAVNTQQITVRDDSSLLNQARNGQADFLNLPQLNRGVPHAFIVSNAHQSDLQERNFSPDHWVAAVFDGNNTIYYANSLAGSPCPASTPISNVATYIKDTLPNI